jgi:hypothetical protein
MPITYSMVGLIGRERSIVLCEQSMTPGAWPDIARKILAKISPKDDKKSFGYEGYADVDDDNSDGMDDGERWSKRSNRSTRQLMVESRGSRRPLW